MSNARRAPILVFGLLLAGACTSTSRNQEPASPDGYELPGDRARARMEHEPIGKFLRDVNSAIRAWTQLTMTAQTDEQRREASGLEQDLERRTGERVDELVLELETGPTPNRVIAASALGFTHDPKAQSPLLAALEDPDVEVQSNALLGLTLLALPDTPLERICELLRNGGDAWVRSNAASCASTLASKGARSDCLLESARQGLSDPEPGVRSQCALTLAALLDTGSLAKLAGLLYDDVPLVCAAAARSLAFIGHEEPTAKARAARDLVKAYTASTGTARRIFLQALVDLSEKAYGDDEDEWRDWARRLQ
jgi:HEAT repeats